ncbi:MAG TPA: hypothetical protein DCW74_20990 [Alteromonas australica]|uniref:Uncharacterized protein n=1 Tax=Alteromonas australica TaxID=589873 RepID=A0A350PA84_9ALTE|nr:hypothetical protein [Alteromonas australica]
MLSLASNSASMSDMVLIQNLMQYVEDDQNLSMLPDEFKRLAVQTMFEDAKRLEHEQEQGIDTSNKRLRSVTEDMIE